MIPTSALLSGVLLSTGVARAEEPAMIQAAVFPEALNRATEFLTPLAFDFARPELSAPLACWDEAGVKNLNLHLEVDEVAVSLVEGGVAVHVDLGQIRGEDMVLFAHDPKDDDLCGNIDADLRWIELMAGAVDLTVAPSVAEDGRLGVALLSGPTLSGELGMDIEWAPTWADGWGWDLWPDDLFLDLLGDDILDLVGQAAAARIPEAADAFLGRVDLSNSIGKLTVDASLTELSVAPEALSAGAGVHIDWAGRNGCAPNEGGPREQGRLPLLDLSPEGDAAMGLGVTERLVNHLAWQAWSDGLFCLNADDVDALLVEHVPGVNPRVTGISASASLGLPPAVVFEDGLLVLDVPELRVHLGGLYNGKMVQVLDLEADLGLAVGVSLDPELAAPVLNLASLQLDITAFESEHLLSDEPGAEVRFVDFLEGFLPTVAKNKVQDLAVGRSVFRVMGFALRLTTLRLDDGGLVVKVAAYAEGDPEVDNLAPETHLELSAQGEDTLIIEHTSVDDREGALPWRWRVDDGPWSAWTLEDTVEVGDLETGSHVVEAEARDAWHNVDPSPSRRRFELDALPRAQVVSTCATGSRGTGSWGLLALGVLLVGRRRRRSRGA